MKYACVLTYGCQMNKHDSEIIKGGFKKAGYEIVKAPSAECSFIVLNTCAVRQNAEDRVLARIRELSGLKKKNPDLKIGVFGCVAQELQEELIKKDKAVSFVAGPSQITKIPELLNNLKNRRVFADDEDDGFNVTAENLHMRESGVSAFVSIMKGCNNFCSYCIVPYVRGRESSRHASDIINEINYLTQKGFREITLLGQNVNSYGKETKKSDFPGLLNKITAAVKDLKWLRFLTSHPKDFSETLIDVMKNNPVLCRHIHLPFQSGSTEILKLMNRGYTKNDYLKLTDKIKKAVPGISLTTDIIVGFPGETDDDFNETVDVMKKARFDAAFIFKYSPRPKTKAYLMEDNCPLELKEERNQKLLNLQCDISRENTKRFIGKNIEIIYNEKGLGRSGENKKAFVKGGNFKKNNFYTVKVKDVKNHSLIAEAL